MPVQPFASVTVTTIGNVPPCVGVPERTPLVASVSPVGSVLDVVNVAVPTAPVCVNVPLKGDPAGPLEFAGLLTAIWLQMTRVKLCGVDPATFVAVKTRW